MAQPIQAEQNDHAWKWPICLLQSELPVHTFALGVCRVTIRLLHSWAVTLPTVNGTSNLFHWRERLEYLKVTIVSGY